jgi:hypothetical protein
MPKTNIRGAQVAPNTIQRSDMDIATVGQAMITSVRPGAGISISATGADAGTGDATISATASGGLTQVTSDSSLAGLGTAASPLSVVAVNGVTNGSAAAAGQVGEMIRAAVTLAAGVALSTSNRIQAVTSIVLTAGDWDVSGSAIFQSTGMASGGQHQGTATCGTSGSAITDDGTQGYTQLCNPAGSSAAIQGSIGLSASRFSVTANTTVYLTVRLVFASGTNIAAGFIQARRVR